MSEKENENVSVFKKWWFWLFILIAIVVVCFSVLVFKAFGEVETNGISQNGSSQNENLLKLEEKLKTIDKNISIYESANKDYILLQCSANTDNAIYEKANEIGQFTTKNKDLLKSYKEMKMYFYSDEGSSTLLIYDIKTDKLNEENNDVWIKVDSPHYKEITKESSSTTSTDSSKSKQTQKESSSEKNVFTSGTYEVGTDIEEGKYDAIAQSGTGGLVVNGSTTVIETLGKDDENFSEKYNNLILKKGDTVQVSGNLKLELIEK